VPSVSRLRTRGRRSTGHFFQTLTLPPLTIVSTSRCASGSAATSVSNVGPGFASLHRLRWFRQNIHRNLAQRNTSRSAVAVHADRLAIAYIQGKTGSPDGTCAERDESASTSACSMSSACSRVATWLLKNRSKAGLRAPTKVAGASGSACWYRSIQ